VLQAQGSCILLGHSLRLALVAACHGPTYHNQAHPLHHHACATGTPCPFPCAPKPQPTQPQPTDQEGGAQYLPIFLR
jgi:hypothetical protein